MKSGLPSANDDIAPSLDRVQRTLSADIAYTISRMKVLERLPGNPVGIGYRWVDETAIALTARLPPLCRVIGLRAEHGAQIEPLVAWYRTRGVKPAFEMVPGHYDESLGRELMRLGFFQSGFHVSLIGTPGTAAPADERIVIEPVADAASLEDYLDAYVAGWEIAEKGGAQFRDNIRPWRDQPGWSLYVGRVNGVPAAAATLYMHGGVGYLADAATHPAFRRQGFQSALLRRRIQDAGAAGADLVFSGAAPFSTSHRNMERTGMRVQFVRSLWTPV